MQINYNLKILPTNFTCWVSHTRDLILQSDYNFQNSRFNLIRSTIPLVVSYFSNLPPERIRFNPTAFEKVTLHFGNNSSYANYYRKSIAFVLLIQSVAINKFNLTRENLKFFFDFNYPGRAIFLSVRRRPWLRAILTENKFDSLTITKTPLISGSGKFFFSSLVEIRPNIYFETKSLINFRFDY